MLWLLYFFWAGYRQIFLENDFKGLFLLDLHLPVTQFYWSTLFSCFFWFPFSCDLIWTIVALKAISDPIVWWESREEKKVFYRSNIVLWKICSLIFELACKLLFTKLYAFAVEWENVQKESLGSVQFVFSLDRLLLR